MAPDYHPGADTLMDELDNEPEENDVDLEEDEEHNSVASEDISPDDDPDDAFIDRPFMGEDEEEE